MKFTVYKRGKEWRWNLKARNGEIIASGESYKRRKDCFKAIDLIKCLDYDTPVDFPNKA